MSEVLSREVAEKEVTKWLNFKRVKQNSRKELKVHIEGMISDFEEGLLSLDPKTFEITMTLMFEATGTKKLVLKPRITAIEKANVLKDAGVDGDSRVIAMLAKLSGKLNAIIGGLDSEDLGTARNVIVFFL